jgi:hypothetical protein
MRFASAAQNTGVEMLPDSLTSDREDTVLPITDKVRKSSTQRWVFTTVGFRVPQSDPSHWH